MKDLVGSDAKVVYCQDWFPKTVTLVPAGGCWKNVMPAVDALPVGKTPILLPRQMRMSALGVYLELDPYLDVLPAHC